MKANKRGVGQAKRRAREGFFNTMIGKIVIYIFLAFASFIAYSILME